MENRNNNPIAEEIIHNNPTGYGLFAGIGDNFNSAAQAICELADDAISNLRANSDDPDLSMTIVVSFENLGDAKKICYTLPCAIEFRRDAMFYTDEEISVITGFLNGYLVRDCASAKVRESYIRISAGLQSHTLTKDDYVWLENALLFLRPYWWSDREDGKMLMDAFLHTQTLAKKE